MASIHGISLAQFVFLFSSIIYPYFYLFSIFHLFIFIFFQFINRFAKPTKDLEGAVGEKVPTSVSIKRKKGEGEVVDYRQKKKPKRTRK